MSVLWNNTPMSQSIWVPCKIWRTNVPWKPSEENWKPNDHVRNPWDRGGLSNKACVVPLHRDSPSKVLSQVGESLIDNVSIHISAKRRTGFIPFRRRNKSFGHCDHKFDTFKGICVTEIVEAIIKWGMAVQLAVNENEGPDGGIPHKDAVL
eukprot:scaffold26209_cov125-Amphora_coffeaeformis.AAC.1